MTSFIGVSAITAIICIAAFRCNNSVHHFSSAVRNSEVSVSQGLKCIASIENAFCARVKCLFYRGVCISGVWISRVPLYTFQPAANNNSFCSMNPYNIKGTVRATNSMYGTVG